MTRKVKIGNVTIGGNKPLVLIAGPCVIESEETTLAIAERIKKIADKISIPFIFKSSYDKANRTSIKSYRGPGLKKGLAILKKVKDELGLPVLTDVHGVSEVEEAAKVVDALQIPAFLCRQTDLILAASKTKKPVNVKKGQFLAPQDARNIIEKIESAGNRNILITERGTSFGYNNLVVDMTAFPILAGFGCPVVFDVTHSLQKPSGEGSFSGGKAEYISPLASAATAMGIDGIFMEVHPEPARALSDSKTVLKLDMLEELLLRLKKIDAIAKTGG